MREIALAEHIMILILFASTDSSNRARARFLKFRPVSLFMYSVATDRTVIKNILTRKSSGGHQAK
jgi:hypothetical protein